MLLGVFIYMILMTSTPKNFHIGDALRYCQSIWLLPFVRLSASKKVTLNIFGKRFHSC